MKKQIAVIMMAAAVSAMGASLAYAGSWQSDERGYWYQNDNGVYMKGATFTIDGATYAFDDSGYMVTGWYRQNGNTPWTYYMPGSGVRQTGWLQDGGKWYYLDPARGGEMKMNAWLNEDNKLYYFDASGVMQTGIFFARSNEGIEYGYQADEHGVVIRNQSVKNGEKEFKYLEDGVMMYRSGDTKRAGYDDTWRYYKQGSEQVAQKESDQMAVAQRGVEIQDMRYEKYLKANQGRSAARRKEKIRHWEDVTREALKKYCTEEEIKTFISKVKAGLYTPSDYAPEADTDEEEDRFYEDEEE